MRLLKLWFCSCPRTNQVNGFGKRNVRVSTQSCSFLPSPWSHRRSSTLWTIPAIGSITNEHDCHWLCVVWFQLAYIQQVFQVDSMAETILILVNPPKNSKRGKKMAARKGTKASRSAAAKKAAATRKRNAAKRSAAAAAATRKRNAKRKPFTRHKILQEAPSFSLRSSQKAAATRRRNKAAGSRSQKSSNQKATLSASSREKHLPSAKAPRLPEVPQPRKHGELAEETLQRDPPQQREAQSAEHPPSAELPSARHLPSAEAPRLLAPQQPRKHGEHAEETLASARHLPSAEDLAESLEQSLSRKPRNWASPSLTQ